MADVNLVIQRCVDDIWDEYDADRSNTLDKEELKRFVLTTIKEFSGAESLEEFSMDDFDKTFDEFDEDKNGTIDRHEMVRFIRRVAGLSAGRL